MRITIKLIAALALSVCAVAGPSAAVAAGPGKLLKREGAWQLALIPIGPGVMMCAATTHDDATRTVFDYMVINRRVTAFRVSGPLIEQMPDAAQVPFVLSVDNGQPVGLLAQKTGMFAVMQIPRDSDAKRDFVRSLAAGKEMTVKDAGGASLARFALRGADPVLRSFGLCVARLPDRDPPS